MAADPTLIFLHESFVTFSGACLRSSVAVVPANVSRNYADALTTEADTWASEVNNWESRKAKLQQLQAGWQARGFHG